MSNEKLPLTGGDTKQAMDVIWEIIGDYKGLRRRDSCHVTDTENNEINTAMAWVQEALDDE